MGIIAKVGNALQSLFGKIAETAAKAAGPRKGTSRRVMLFNKRSNDELIIIILHSRSVQAYAAESLYTV